MRVRAKDAVAAVALSALTACAHSAPTRFFTLGPSPPERPVAAGSAVAVPVQLLAVHIPAALDRPQVVTQPGANRLDVHDLDQWASPLGEMMRQTLAQDLLSRLPEGAFVLPDAPRAARVRGLVVDVLALEAAPDGRVTLQASWTLMAPGAPQPALVRDVQLTADAEPGPDGAAAGFSRLLGQLADQISAAVAAG
jgi:uncharacterized lipoprotein YmbA